MLKLENMYFKRNIDNPYSNFRNINYIAQSLNVEAFDEDYETISLFSGDVVVSPLRYLSSVFWDNTVARRVGKKSVLKKILGVFLIVAAVLVVADEHHVHLSRTTSLISVVIKMTSHLSMSVVEEPVVCLFVVAIPFL